MGVTTEPPWVNKASGTAARNGTSAHTISFGFTSTSGNLLVVFVHGAVTHTASGWTEQAQPVATGECSMFTKTSAGESSISVTHNGSNYPVNWVAYEFYTGSSVTGVDSTTGSNDTMVALTGLPGTEQVIFGALGRVAIGSETGASISPSSPWVEDGDLFAAASGTDGSYLAVVHQLNVTSTSATPVVSPTYTGTWSNGSREKISAAINVTMPPSTWTKDWSTTWRITNSFTKDWSTTWRVSNAFTKDWADTWRITNAFSKDYDTTWRIQNAWSKDYDTTWRVSNSFTKDWADTWRITNAWNADWVSEWRITNAFTKDYSSTWNIFEDTTWVKDWADTWRITNVFTADWVTTWRVLNAWSADYTTTWRVSNSWVKDYADTWRIRTLFHKDWSSTWTIFSDITLPPLPADVVCHLENAVTANLAAETVTVRLG